MSRIAKQPITVPSGVDIKIDNGMIAVKGAKGQLQLLVHKGVDVNQEGSEIKVTYKEGDKAIHALGGTTRALISNMVTGVTDGFEKKLNLVGVGYRAQAQGKALNLTLGFSHPVNYPIPDGIAIETPSQTEISVKGIDKQRVGQVAAEIRAYRPPEPYKGKGVRYADETISLKEAKKK